MVPSRGLEPPPLSGQSLKLLRIPFRHEGIVPDVSSGEMHAFAMTSAYGLSSLLYSHRSTKFRVANTWILPIAPSRYTKERAFVKALLRCPGQLHTQDDYLGRKIAQTRQKMKQVGAHPVTIYRPNTVE
jgi:hypothetical protein